MKCIGNVTKGEWQVFPHYELEHFRRTMRIRVLEDPKLLVLRRCNT